MQMTKNYNEIPRLLKKFSEKNKNNLQITKTLFEKIKKEYTFFYDNTENVLADTKRDFDILYKWIFDSERAELILTEKEICLNDCDLIKNLDIFFFAVFCSDDKTAKKYIKKIYDNVFKIDGIGDDLEKSIYFKEINLDKDYIKDLVNKINELLKDLNENIGNHNINYLNNDNITNTQIIFTLKHISDLLYNVLIDKIKNETIPKLASKKYSDKHSAFNYATIFLKCLCMFFEILEDKTLKEILEKSQNVYRPKIKLSIDKYIFKNSFKNTSNEIKRSNFDPDKIGKIENRLKQFNIELDLKLGDLIKYIKNL